ncbi:MAG TPA: hypothetical protein VFL62_20910 [Bradyrhizobium sp.]|nr:hypothetical protein [Bradyrhizobium sp.]
MDAILVATGVCVIFLVFAFVVAWADHTTSKWISERTAKQAAAGTQPPYHEAA